MTGLDLDLDLVPEPSPSPLTVIMARQRRALVVGLGGGREGESPMAKSSFAERRPQASETVATRLADPAANSAGVAAPCPGAAVRDSRPGTRAALPLDDALTVPAGALIHGYLRCRALLLVGDIVGNVHCTGGPVVIRSGASLKGRLVATGDVYVCGTVGAGDGGAVISTRGKLTLASGARVFGDVRSTRLDVHDGAILQGAARPGED